MNCKKTLRMAAAVPIAVSNPRLRDRLNIENQLLPDLNEPLFVYSQGAKLQLSGFAPKALLIDLVA